MSHVSQVLTDGEIPAIPADALHGKVLVGAQNVFRAHDVPDDSETPPDSDILT